MRAQIGDQNGRQRFTRSNIVCAKSMSPPNVAAATQSPASQGKPATNFRWVILGLLFFATTINYLDRNVMGILAKDLKEIFSISDSQYGDIQGAFAIAYACGQLVCG